MKPRQTKHSSAGRDGKQRTGMVLVVVLVVIALLSLAAYSFSDLMLSERMSVDAHGRQMQARALADSGLEIVKHFLTQDQEMQTQQGGIYDNPGQFRGILLLDGGTPRTRGGVSILAPLVEDGQATGVRFGLEDESTKLNLHTLLLFEQQKGAEDAIQQLTQGGTSGGNAGGSGGSGQSSGGRSGSLSGGTGVGGTGGGGAAGGGNSGGGSGSGGSGGGGAGGGGASGGGGTSGGGGGTGGGNSGRGGTSGGGGQNSSGQSNSSRQVDPSLPTDGESAARDLLMKLPAMTEDVADAILDWIDEDDEPRTYGAEREYYSGLSPGYAPANRPPETLDELLLVRGVTPELLYGPDSNRNGMIDPAEQAAAESVQVDAAAGVIDRGWSGYLTLYSKEENVRPDGTPRIDLNGEDLELLHTELSEALNTDWANFIVLYRQFGPYRGTKVGQQVSGVQIDFKQAAKTKLTTVLDLVGPAVEISMGSGERAQKVVIDSPFPNIAAVMNSYLPLLLDHVTVNKNASIPGRININQAPRTILEGIPGMTPETVEAIISRREAEYSQTKPDHRHETWLMSEGVVTLEEMKALMPFVTSSGSVYRTQIVGYYEQGGPSTRIEAIVDATSASPRLLFWRDISHLGRGFSLSTLGITASQ